MQVAGPKEQLAKIFNEEARKYAAAFPDELKNLLVTVAGEVVYVSPEFVPVFEEHADALQNCIDQSLQSIRQTGTNGGATRGTIAGIPFSYALFDPDLHINADLLVSIDHEFGHLATRDGFNSGNSHLQECIANAHQTLRHIQRFGADTDYIAQAAAQSAMHIVWCGLPDHYAPAAIEKVIKIQKEWEQHGTGINIAALSLQETAVLANKIGHQYSLDEQTLAKVANAYQHITPFYKKGDWANIFAKLFQILVQHADDHDIYRAGKYFFELPMARQMITDGLLQTEMAILKQLEKATGFSLEAISEGQSKKTAKRAPKA